MSTSKQTPPKKKTVLVVNAGTYCDGTLAEEVLAALHGFEVVYLTDENLRPKGRKLKIKVYTYRTPSFILMDPELPASDPTRSPIRWALTHPVRAQKVYEWVQTVGESISDLEGRHSPQCVLLHFSLMASLMWIERNRAPGMLASVPHVLMYYDPGIPNATIPWLFDGRLKNKGFQLYNERKTSDVVLDSWNETLSRMSLNNGVTSSDDGLRRTVCALRSVRHAICWDSAMTPPLKALIPGMTADYVGGFVDRSNVSKSAHFRSLPEDLRAFIEQNRRERGRSVAFVAFGSVSHLNRLRNIAASIGSELISRKYAVIFHDASPDPENLEVVMEDEAKRPMFYVHRGYVSYEAIVPNVDLVTFAGSLCLQMTCLKNAIPMLMVPLTTEQHFWAKNYRHFTGVDYVTVNSCVPKAVKSLTTRRAQVKDYLTTVKKSLVANNTRGNLRRFVVGVIEDHVDLQNKSALRQAS